mgnify:CR=1 FL=1
MAKVLIKTSEGDIKVRLYDETPQHRDNFLKLAKEGYFDGRWACRWSRTSSTSLPRSTMMKS